VSSQSPQKPIISLAGVSKAFGATRVLNEINL
jgi:polar amino acid transport system ATP-binding protein